MKTGLAALLTASITLASNLLSQTPQDHDWSVYLGENSAHYSPLTQIDKTNVKQLQVAWSYDTEETGGLQTSPIVVHGILYGISPSQKVFALDAATGKLKWKFDSGVVGTQPDRGLAYWENGGDRRILVGVMNFVYELSAEDGKAISAFGDHGRIDLRENLGRDIEGMFIALTSPPVVYKDLFIVGGRLSETLPCPPGDIRAYDVRTGKLRWSFHTIPHSGEFGYETWPKEAWKTIGSANNWTGMT
ncbi:MAG TPA: PQQ-binding-like beta-propeller repeat protein, partial [Terriglobales bacterium]|nr:PQQ-binding-like beta-propeller repeat protein [Terriglobales bacterium]